MSVFCSLSEYIAGIFALRLQHTSAGVYVFIVLRQKRNEGYRVRLRMRDRKQADDREGGSGKHHVTNPDHVTLNIEHQTISRAEHVGRTQVM